MKNIFVIFLVMGLASCATSKGSRKSRVIASTAPKCTLAKHKKKNWFRVEKEGKPFSKYWYSAGKAQERLKSHIGNGHCVE